MSFWLKELHKSIIRKFKKRIVYPGFKDNVWGANLADMQLISKFNRWFRFLLCVIGVFSKYAWVVTLKDKKGITITNVFRKILKGSNRKPKKIWVDKGSEYYDSSVKKWLKDNNIEMYSIHYEGKSVVSERFIRTLNDIVNECSNTYHRTIKMKPVDVQDNTYIDSTELHSSKEVNDRDPKFKVGDHVRISNYKNIFAKG